MSTPEIVVEELVLERAGVPRDMFGIDSGKVKPYTAQDRIEDR